MALLTRRIDVTFTLGDGDFGLAAPQQNVATIVGKRISVSMRKAGGLGLTELDMRIYGLSPNVMNAVSTLGKPLPSIRNNVVRVSAGDDVNGMVTVFEGIIQQAWADLQSPPDSTFVVQATTGLLDALKPIAPTTVKGSADAALLISGIAGKLNYKFENNGVSVMLANPYYSGTGIQQAQNIALAAHINFLVESNTLIIWPKGTVRNFPDVAVSLQTGMVGYPRWTAQGISVTTLYNPNIIYGAPVVVTSSAIPQANGRWSPFMINQELESQIVGGRWFTMFEASVFGTAALGRQ